VVGAVEDLERDLEVDLVVRPAERAGGRHGAARRVLAGPRYALVDPSLRTRPRRPVDDRAAAVLVMTGAADEGGVGAGIAAELASRLPEVDVRVVIGPWGRGIPGKGVRSVEASASLIDILASVDLVVTAGGVTMIESLVLGRPTVAVVIAENQRAAVEDAVSAGAVVESSPADAPAVAQALAEDRQRRRRLAAAAATYVDGRGAERVGRELCALLV
jgi:spore coat polysaccharide biosynthesis predicted glycosyltransferase SpsG